MEIKALIELEGSIVVLPVFAEEFEEPLGGELVAAIFLVFIVR